MILKLVIFQSVVIVGIMLSCFLFYIGPNFYSILIHRTEEPESVRATLQTVLLALIWFAGVSWVVKSRFFRFAILFTVSILVALLGIALLLMEDQRTAMHFLAPIVHCLGCLVGAVFGLYFNRFGINAVSGCWLGIISAALIMQSIKVMCATDLGRVLGRVLLKHFCLALFHYARWVLTVYFPMLSLSGDSDMDKLFTALVFMGTSIITYLFLKFRHTHNNIIFFVMYVVWGLFSGFILFVYIAIADKEYAHIYFIVGSPFFVFPIFFAAVGWYCFGLIGIPICTFTGFYTAIFVLVLSIVDTDDEWENVSRNLLVLCFTFRLLGAGIGSLLVLPLFSFFRLLGAGLGSLLVLPLFSFFGLLASSLAEKAIKMFSFDFIKSIWQYTANLGGQYDIVYGAFMWMKQHHEGLVGSFGLSLAMLVGVTPIFLFVLFFVLM